MGRNSTKSATRPVATANAYPIGLEKYKYNPKMVSIPAEKNGIVHLGEEKFQVHDLTKKSVYPTNVDISELPYEVGMYFDKNGMPLISYTTDIYSTKKPKSESEYGAYVFTDKSKYRLPNYFRSKEDTKDTIHIHNHPKPAAFSSNDIFRAASDMPFKSIVRPIQKPTKNIMQELLNNKKNLLANFKMQMKQSGYTMGVYKNKKLVSEELVAHNDLEKKVLKNLYDFVKNINKKNLQKFVYFELNNLGNFQDFYKQNKSYKVKGKRKFLIDDVKNDWMKNLYMPIPTYSKKYPTNYSTKASDFLFVIKTNFALANKYNYNFEIKYA